SERGLIVGGPHLAAAMIATNLVDELHAFVHPIIIGAGTPWLPRDLCIPLELAGERRLGRAVHLHYRRSYAPHEQKSNRSLHGSPAPPAIGSGVRSPSYSSQPGGPSY